MNLIILISFSVNILLNNKLCIFLLHNLPHQYAHTPSNFYRFDSCSSTLSTCPYCNVDACNDDIQSPLTLFTCLKSSSFLRQVQTWCTWCPFYGVRHFLPHQRPNIEMELLGQQQECLPNDLRCSQPKNVDPPPQKLTIE